MKYLAILFIGFFGVFTFGTALLAPLEIIIRMMPIMIFTGVMAVIIFIMAVLNESM